MTELLANYNDVAFARSMAEQYETAFLRVDVLGFDRREKRGNREAARLLQSIELEVNRYIGDSESFLTPDLRSFLEIEITLARRLTSDIHGRVYMLDQVDNAFNLAVIVDIFNDSAIDTLINMGQNTHGDDDTNPPAQPISPSVIRQFLDDVEQRPGPTRVADEREGTTSFLTLFSDALRMSALGKTLTKPSLVYTANCNLKGWILEAWPQYKFSPKRFGHTVTWPVKDTLPTSGNYMFQGRKGMSVRQDPAPHYLGPTRTTTLVQL